MQATRIDVAAEHAEEFHRADLAREAAHRDLLAAAETGDLHAELDAGHRRDLYQAIADEALERGCRLDARRFTVRLAELNGLDPAQVLAQEGQQ